MSWFRTKDNRKVENVPWQERLNAEYWIPDPKHSGQVTPVPFRCEHCRKDFALYGDELGLHCISCWLRKKALT